MRLVRLKLRYELHGSTQKDVQRSCLMGGSATTFCLTQVIRGHLDSIEAVVMFGLRSGSVVITFWNHPKARVVCMLW